MGRQPSRALSNTPAQCMPPLACRPGPTQHPADAHLSCGVEEARRRCTDCSNPWMLSGWLASGSEAAAAAALGALRAGRPLVSLTAPAAAATASLPVPARRRFCLLADSWPSTSRERLLLPPAFAGPPPPPPVTSPAGCWPLPACALAIVSRPPGAALAGAACPSWLRVVVRRALAPDRPSRPGVGPVCRQGGDGEH